MRILGEILRQIGRWRSSADELVGAADTVRNEVAPDHLLDVAQGYDRLADHMADLVAKRRALQKKQGAAQF
jgi:hypothetical protein